MSSVRALRSVRCCACSKPMFLSAHESDAHCKTCIGTPTPGAIHSVDATIEPIEIDEHEEKKEEENEERIETHEDDEDTVDAHVALPFVSVPVTIHVGIEHKPKNHPYFAHGSEFGFVFRKGDVVYRTHLPLYRNWIYEFIFSNNPEMRKHPMYFTTDAIGGAQYERGAITSPAKSTGTLTVVTSDWPHNLYVQCERHAYMGMPVSVIDAPLYLLSKIGASFNWRSALGFHERHRLRGSFKPFRLLFVEHWQLLRPWMIGEALDKAGSHATYHQIQQAAYTLMNRREMRDLLGDWKRTCGAYGFRAAGMSVATSAKLFSNGISSWTSELARDSLTVILGNKPTHTDPSFYHHDIIKAMADFFAGDVSWENTKKEMEAFFEKYNSCVLRYATVQSLKKLGEALAERDTDCRKTAEDSGRGFDEDALTYNTLPAFERE